MSRHISLRALTGALGFAAVASCSHVGTEVLGENAVQGDMFARYVAIGNSITAGFQAGGITATTQRASYPVLLARSMGTQMALPIMAGRGCNPPVSNFATQAGPTGISATARTTICDFRDPAFSVDILNNVGVPGARVHDPTAKGTAASPTSTSNTLTTLILGGMTQVERANLANPTFVSIWIGNNDVLGPAVSPGTTTALTTAIDAIIDSATFAGHYNRMLDSLMVHNPDLEGVLVGVANVTALPLLFAGSNMTSASFKTQFDAIACSANPPAGSAFTGCFGAGTTVVGCTGSTALINLSLAFAIVRGQHPGTVSCVPTGTAVGDLFVLSTAEQATITSRVTQYNNHISARATALGWAYFDPNNTTNGLPALRSDTTNSLIRITPSPVSTTNPFGTGMSFDGVHPGNTLHVRIANAIIAVINTKYGTSLPAAQ